MKPKGPLMFAAESFHLIAVALLACRLGPSPSTKIDPMVALPYE